LFGLGRKANSRAALVSKVADFLGEEINKGRSKIDSNTSTSEAFNIGMLTAATVLEAYALMQEDGDKQNTIASMSLLLKAAAGINPDA